MLKKLFSKRYQVVDDSAEIALPSVESMQSIVERNRDKALIDAKKKIATELIKISKDSTKDGHSIWNFTKQITSYDSIWLTIEQVLSIGKIREIQQWFQEHKYNGFIAYYDHSGKRMLLGFAIRWMPKQHNVEIPRSIMINKQSREIHLILFGGYPVSRT